MTAMPPVVPAAPSPPEAKRRYRRMWTDMLSDINFRRLPSRCRETLLAWQSEPFVHTIPGVAIIDAPGLAAFYFCSTAAARKALGHLRAESYIAWDDSAGWGFCWAHWDANEPNSPAVVVGWARAWASLPECPLKSELADFITDYMVARGAPWVSAWSQVLATKPVAPVACQQETTLGRCPSSFFGQSTGGSSPLKTGGSSPLKTGGSSPLKTGGSSPLKTGGSSPLFPPDPPSLGRKVGRKVEEMGKEAAASLSDLLDPNGGAGATGGMIPPTGQGMIPPTGQGMIPPTGQGMIPPTGQGMIPPTGQGMIPPTGQGMIPPHVSEIIPDPDDDPYPPGGTRNRDASLPSANNTGAPRASTGGQQTPRNGHPRPMRDGADRFAQRCNIDDEGEAQSDPEGFWEMVDRLLRFAHEQGKVGRRDGVFFGWDTARDEYEIVCAARHVLRRRAQTALECEDFLRLVFAGAARDTGFRAWIKPGTTNPVDLYRSPLHVLGRADDDSRWGYDQRMTEHADRAIRIRQSDPARARDAPVGTWPPFRLVHEKPDGWIDALNAQIPYDSDLWRRWSYGEVNYDTDAVIRAHLALPPLTFSEWHAIRRESAGVVAA